MEPYAWMAENWWKLLRNLDKCLLDHIPANLQVDLLNSVSFFIVSAVTFLPIKKPIPLFRILQAVSEPLHVAL